MKDKISKYLDIFCECANFIIISYALLNMMSFRQSFLYVLFFASNVWLIARFCSRITKLTGSKIAAAVLFAVCVLAVAALGFFVGTVSGKLIRFEL